MFTTKLTQLQIKRDSFFADPLNFVSLGLSLLINIIHWSILYIKLKSVTGTIVLHYNVIYGTDFVDKAKYAFLAPAMALIILIANMIFASVFFKKEKLAAHFLNFANIAIQLIFLTASVLLLWNNAS